MIGSVDYSDNEKEIDIPILKSLLEQNKDKTVVVPLNLLFVLEYFLRASCWYADMNTSSVPYPSFENTSSRLSYYLKDIITDSNHGERVKKMFGGAEYTIYKMLNDCDDDELINKLLKGEWNKDDKAKQTED